MAASTTRMRGPGPQTGTGWTASCIIWADSLREIDLIGDLTFTPAMGGGSKTVSIMQAVVQIFNHQTHHRGQVHAMLTAAGETAPVSRISFLCRSPPSDGPDFPLAPRAAHNFSDGVEAAGVKAYTVYNRMLLPTIFTASKRITITLRSRAGLGRCLRTAG